ncbi:MAG: HNH endonuclease [Gallionella sp.]|nr:HNH endonuclease [Gallionella sp.]MDD4958195.1 HNH endonuclease [Gallionella sp.]
MQLKLAFYLYCQLPFGKLHSRNPEIIELATLIERTPSAVAMKLVNFASLDPAITSTGRSGLGNASALDREIWNEFNANWEEAASECYELRTALEADKQPVISQQVTMELDEFDLQDFTGETKRVMTTQRVKQAFFRRAVLSSYQGRCCMSGLSEPKLLIASHIVPWSKHKEHRLNPRNGLCLSALHDKAFDGGLLTLTDDFRILISKALSQRKESFIEQVLLPLAGKVITMPERFAPAPAFIAQHRAEIFLDDR